MLIIRRLLPWAALALASLAWAGTAAPERGPVRHLPQPALANAQGRVIVKYKEGAGVLRAQAASAGNARQGPQHAAALGARLGLNLSDGRAIDGRTQVIHAAGQDSAALAQRLAQDADVAWAVVDQRRYAYAAPTDPLYASAGSPAAGQWYLRAPTSQVLSSLDVETAWAVTQGNSSLVVAVLDTGVRKDHPDLASKLVAGYDFVGFSAPSVYTSAEGLAMANDGSLADADPSDPGDWITTAEDASGQFQGCGQTNSTWHGTEVSGLIGAATNNGIGMAGVAPNVKLLPVRVLGKCGGYDSDIIAGMRWAAGLSVSGVATNANPARVINMSLGSKGTCSQAYQSVITELTAAKVVVVVAAGNDGLTVGTPGNCSGVVAVAGVRHSGTKVGYSNLGSAVTIAAPAGNCVNTTGECLYPLLSTSNTGTTSPVAGAAGAKYTTGGSDASLGTSFATPLVAGTVALMLSANAQLSNDQVISALKSTARPFPSTGAGAGVAACTAPTSVAQSSECYCTTTTCGAGLLDAGAAVAAVAAAAAPTVNISATPSSPVAGATVQLDGSSSQVATGRSIASYQWTLSSGASLATFTTATNLSMVTLDTLAAGNVTVTLTVTDSAGSQASASKTLTVTASSLAPVITASGTPAAGDVVTLSAASSTVDSGRSIASYQWTLTSGSSAASLSGASTSATATLQTNAAGTVTVQLTITDSVGLSASTSKTITVAAASLAPVITASSGNPVVGDTLTLSAASSTLDSGRSIAAYRWSITSGTAVASLSGDATSATASLQANAAGSVTVQLTLTDSDGISASTTKTVTVSAASAGSTGITSGSSGGGGAWSPLWSLGLLLAAAALPARRRLRG